MNSSLNFKFDNFVTEIIFSESNLLPLPLDNCLFVCDEHTLNLFPIPLEKTVILKSGEIHKEWAAVEEILKKAVSLKLARDSYFVGVGGGVICDMTAFASSVYMRGSQLILVPTTVLAMVDAAIGGKTGFDFLSYKNLIGTFYPAQRLHINVSSLSTLSDKEFQSGLAEVIKTAMLGDEELFQILERDSKNILLKDSNILKEIIFRCIKVKGNIVEKDLKEKNIRAYLNLGHTFGHALESATNFSGWSHGEAVAWGIGRALEAGISLGQTNPEYAKRVEKLLFQYGFTRKSEENPEAVFQALFFDKKKTDGKLRFILQKDICDTFITEIDRELIKQVIQNG